MMTGGTGPEQWARAVGSRSAVDRSEELADPARLRAVAATGVDATLDADLQRFARLASNVLGTPVALVSILERDQQVFPGQVGLPEPWAAMRATPLSHSVCQHVTATREPLVVPDVRLDELTADSLAIPDLGVVAYAGMPLTDDSGAAFGALCAIDHERREWTEQEVDLLREIADACSAELRLRIAARREAVVRAELERGRERAELMLVAATSIAEAGSLTDLRARISQMVDGPLAPSFVGLTVARDDRRLVRVPGPGGPTPLESEHAVFDLDAGWPTARCVAEQRTIVVRDPDELLADGYDADAAAQWERHGLRSAVCVPLVGSHRVVGALTFCWDEPHDMDLTEDAALSTVAGFAATAVTRLVALEQRTTAATELQRALLSDPPEVPGLEVATLYRPSASSDMVGGDWYDLHPLRLADDADTAAPGRPGTVALTLGDISGHDMRAAAMMGQARSMLRQAGIDAAVPSPARAIDAVQRAAEVLGLELSGTVVHGHLTPADEGWDLVWTNAGHPPPIVICPDGSHVVLDEHDVLLYPGLELGDRTDHRTRLVPGAVLVVHTDGLLDDRRTDQVEMAEEVATTAAALLAEGLPLTAVVEQMADRLLGSRAEDDVAVIAVRVGSTR